jgi:hypothetical protein
MIMTLLTPGELINHSSFSDISFLNFVPASSCDVTAFLSVGARLEL